MVVKSLKMSYYFWNDIIYVNKFDNITLNIIQKFI